MKNNSIDQIKSVVESIYSNSTQKKYWGHTLRVLRFSNSIGLKEGARMDILLPATLLHDIGNTVDASFLGHVKKSQLLSKYILQGFGYDDKMINSILKVIGSHHPEPGSSLETIEEKVLFDADNMEIIGVFGSLRWIGSLPQTTAELNSAIDLFVSIVDKCVAARGSLFYTDTAKQLGDEPLRSTMDYYKKMKHYISQFDGDNENPSPIAF